MNSLSDELAEAKKLPVADGKGNPQVEPNASASESCTNCSKISSERDRLYNALQKFTHGSEMLNVILMNQRAYRDKTGLVYRHKEKRWVEPKVKPYLKFFHKASCHTSSPFSFCNYCNRKGHSTSTCNAKRHGTNSTHKWVPKETKLPKDFPRQDTKGVRRSRAWKPFPKEIHPPRAC